MNRIAHLLALSLVVFGLSAEPSLGQSYPAKTVRIVVPYPPGGATDIAGRAIAQKLTEAWHQPVVVDNRPGAGGNIGADAVAKSPPDGYTILYAIHGLAISRSLYRKLPFDAAKDFTPVTQLMSSFLVLMTTPAVPAANLKEFIQLAKSKPGTLVYGTGGVGVPGHLGIELLKIMAGIDMLHVPYKGDAQTNPALLSNEIQLTFGPLSGVLGHIKSGKMRALGISAGVRSPAIPDVPTVAEAGVPGFELAGWVGLFLPAKAARDIVGKVQADSAKAIFTPDIRDRLPGWGYDPVGSTPEDFATRFQADIAKYARVIKEARVPLQD